MNFGKGEAGSRSPYVAFTDDRERKWALVSRDVRWVLVALFLALGEGHPISWTGVWKFISG